MSARSPRSLTVTLGSLLIATIVGGCRPDRAVSPLPLEPTARSAAVSPTNGLYVPSDLGLIQLGYRTIGRSSARTGFHILTPDQIPAATLRRLREVMPPGFVPARVRMATPLDARIGFAALPRVLRDSILALAAHARLESSGEMASDIASRSVFGSFIDGEDGPCTAGTYCLLGSWTMTVDAAGFAVPAPLIGVVGDGFNGGSYVGSTSLSDSYGLPYVGVGIEVLATTLLYERGTHFWSFDGVTVPYAFSDASRNVD